MTPQRIVSVVPSQTELLFDLGLDTEVAGITRFCIHPADKVQAKTKVGGTKTLNLDQIHALQPDLILANKEENTREQIEALQRQYPVYVTDINTLPDALAMIRAVGGLVGREHEAEAMAQQIASNLSSSFPHSSPPLSVAYFIWRKPYMVAASNTFIDAMLEAAGFRNAFASQTRYPEITSDDLRAAHPDLIFLSSEPYPFADKHRAELNAICPSAQALVVDGEVFSWYGSRLLRAGDYFRTLNSKIALLK
ncbi:ABC transporter substrate-binding protein [Spirosoma utsteinense]|uniref:ABC-type Fe3+-hydroxamate transport system substrate-binding protein n=1 Tax=Spirosoma utsteinense TaxID=2585773 RepID=A0ABR6WA40_9BACT|nr:helical backbone metal receptor [Spirosoma utsteinense]MBC3784089.1 ABC-type Fe3+-hydroxamate transport system substrate-binding protein [Spirosoma utsteinense]MBC3792821.1 ABC-type Fe3+-hydroxamate transport system substrate-binding protein [Spirosoma utsteinense]